LDTQDLGVGSGSECHEWLAGKPETLFDFQSYGGSEFAVDNHKKIILSS